MKKKILLLIFICSAVLAFGQRPNILTEVEKNEGWKLLFDGKTTSGWRKFKSDKAPAAWTVNNEALYFDASKKIKGQPETGGDLVTEAEYENYELSMEWKIEACGNSGVIFNVQEGDQYDVVWKTGPEMQVLDNTCHPDAKIIKHRAGDLYDLISCNRETVKPAGQWNLAKIISSQGRYEFWLNGVKTVEFVMNNPEWDLLVATSKFKDMPDFGKFTKGRIALQDHNNQVWFRNIKIKEVQ